MPFETKCARDFQNTLSLAQILKIRQATQSHVANAKEKINLLPNQTIKKESRAHFVSTYCCGSADVKKVRKKRFLRKLELAKGKKRLKIALICTYFCANK